MTYLRFSFLRDGEGRGEDRGGGQQHAPRIATPPPRTTELVLAIEFHAFVNQLLPKSSLSTVGQMLHEVEEDVSIPRPHPTPNQEPRTVQCCTIQLPNDWPCQSLSDPVFAIAVLS